MVGHRKHQRVQLGTASAGGATSTPIAIGWRGHCTEAFWSFGLGRPARMARSLKQHGNAGKSTQSSNPSFKSTLETSDFRLKPPEA